MLNKNYLSTWLQINPFPTIKDMNRGQAIFKSLTPDNFQRVLDDNYYILHPNESAVMPEDNVIELSLYQTVLDNSIYYSFFVKYMNEILPIVKELIKARQNWYEEMDKARKIQVARYKESHPLLSSVWSPDRKWGEFLKGKGKKIRKSKKHNKFNKKSNKK